MPNDLSTTLEGARGAAMAMPEGSGLTLRDIDAVRPHDYNDECPCDCCQSELMRDSVREAFNRTFQWECHKITVGMFILELQKLGYTITATN